MNRILAYTGIKNSKEVLKFSIRFWVLLQWLGKNWGFFQIFNIQFSCLYGNMINTAAFEMSWNCLVGFMQISHLDIPVWRGCSFIGPKKSTFWLVGLYSFGWVRWDQKKTSKQDSTRFPSRHHRWEVVIFPFDQFSMSRMWDMKKRGWLVDWIFGGG